MDIEKVDIVYDIVCRKRIIKIVKSVAKHFHFH